MEPFALFNLLKSFLPQTEISNPPTANEPASAKTDSEPLNEVSPPIQTQNGESNDPPSQNYCLDFIRRHEERAGRKR